MENRRSLGLGGLQEQLKHKAQYNLQKWKPRTCQADYGGISWANLKENNEDTAIKKHFSAKCHYYLKSYITISPAAEVHIAVTTVVSCRPMSNKRGPLLGRLLHEAGVLPASMGAVNNVEGDLAWGSAV